MLDVGAMGNFLNVWLFMLTMNIDKYSMDFMRVLLISRKRVLLFD